MRLVIPNIGDEVSTKFLIYDYVSGKGQPDEAVGSDVVTIRPWIQGRTPQVGIK